MKQVRAVKIQEHPLIQVLILNLNSHFHKILRNLFLSFLSCTLFSGYAVYAQSWSISPKLNISKDENQRLHLRTPEISRADDFETILTALALRHPFTNLRIEKINDEWIVDGDLGIPITKIDFLLAPLALMQSLRAISAPYIGQVHSEMLSQRIALDVKTALIRKGYLEAKVKTTSLIHEQGIEYSYELDIGSPCIVQGYKWEQTPPIKTDQSLKVGDICDLEDAEKAISETESKARANGYAEANLSFESFVFEKNSSFALVKVKGEFGRKVVYEFVDQATNKNLSSVFSNADMQSFDPSILSPESVPFELLRQLKVRGYSNAQVTNTSVSELNSNEVLYKFIVQLGESSVIGRLQVEGNVAFASNEIFNLLGIERPTQSEEQASEVVYNPDAIASGVERIRAHYINNGFWDVKVIDRQIQSQSSISGQNEYVVVVISIEEGSQRIFERTAISGNEAVSTSEINEFVSFKPGDSIDRSKIVELQQKTRSLYASKGYFYTSVSCETTSRSVGGGNLDTIIVVKVDEGPRVKFGDIFITGLVKTNPKVVYRELYFKTGDWYDPELVKLSNKALLRIGAFSSSVILPLDSDIAFKRSEIVDLVIQVTESPTRTVTFGPGWSSYYGMRYNVEAALTNIGGMGRQLYGRANFNEEAHQKAIGSKTLIGRSISTGYLEPHLFDTDLDGTISLSQGARATEYAWSLTRGGEVEISHSLKSIVPGSKISLFYARKLNDEEGAKEDVDAFLADTFSVGRTGFRFNLDKRNDPTWASSGYTLSSEFSWARYEFGGDLRYFRWEATNNQYFSIIEDLVFALGLNYTSFEGVERKGVADADILPSSERLPAGGADSIRGFKERSLGPIVRRPSLNALQQWDCGFTASPTGGSRRLVLKAETRYRFTSALGGTLFIDSGSSSFSRTEMEKFERAFANDSVTIDNPQCPGQPTRSIEENLGYELGDAISKPEIFWQRNFTSLGTAINFLTPIGAVNLAYGVPWHEPQSKKCKTNPAYCYDHSDKTVPLWKRGEVHFNVGAKF